MTTDGQMREEIAEALQSIERQEQVKKPYGTAERIRSLASAAFSPKSCLYHYLSMAKGNYRDYLQGERVRAKKYFYVLRPILACGWIERYGTMPPMQFGELIGALLPGPGEPRAAIDALLVRKMAGDELDHGPRIGAINDYLEERIAYFERLAPGLRTAADAEGLKTESLNGLFRLALQEAWGNELWQGWSKGTPR